MNVQTFQAPTMADALAKVKHELGSAAVILHTRSFKQGGMMGLGARTIVEITASANVNVQARKKTPTRTQSQGSQSMGSHSNSSTAVLDAPAPHRHPLK